MCLEKRMKDFRMELKVCEACGTLWLRANGAGVYCRGCVSVFADFPTTHASRRRGRKRKTEVRTVVCAGGAR